MHGEDQMKDKTREVSKQEQWCPPPVGVYKVNVDAAVHKEQHLMGLGAVIRDSHGQVISAAIQNLEFQGDVSVAKAQAVKWGMELALEAKVTAVIIETDCLEVAHLANDRSSSKKEITWTIAEIQGSKSNF